MHCFIFTFDYSAILQTLRFHFKYFHFVYFILPFLFSSAQRHDIFIHLAVDTILLFILFLVHWNTISHIYCIWETRQNKTVVILNKLFKMKILSGWSGRSVFWYPLVSSKLTKILGFKGYLPRPLTPRSKPELGRPLLSRERAKLKGRGKTENWDSPYMCLHICY